MSDQLSEHDEVICGIARLEAGQDGIKSRLDKINGSVGKLWHELNETQQDLVKHSRDCPLWEKLQELDGQLARGEHPGSQAVNKRLEKLEVRILAGEEIDVATKCARKEWLEWVRPLIMAILVVIAVLALEHAQVVLPHVRP